MLGEISREMSGEILGELSREMSGEMSGEMPGAMSGELKQNEFKNLKCLVSSII